MARVLLAAAVLAAAAASVAGRETLTSLMFQVEPKTEDCVHEDLKAGTEVDAQVLVTRGGKLDVRFRVRGSARGSAGVGRQHTPRRTAGAD